MSELVDSIPYKSDRPSSLSLSLPLESAMLVLVLVWVQPSPGRLVAGARGTGFGLLAGALEPSLQRLWMMGVFRSVVRHSWWFGFHRMHIPGHKCDWSSACGVVSFFGKREREPAFYRQKCVCACACVCVCVS